MFQLTEGAKEICLKTLSPQGEYSFKANRSIENGQVRWRLSGVFSGEAIKDDGPMADGNLFSQFDAEWDELVGDILNSGSVATYSAEYEDGGVIKGTVSEDVFDFDSKSDLYGLDFPVSYNEANVNDDALLDKIKSEDDLIRFAARMLGSRWRQGENTILDIFYLLLSVHRSYLLPGNILNARSLDDLEYLAKNILQSAAFVVASSRLADDAPVQAVRHFSLQAKATFLKKIAEWIIKKYDINLTRIGGESEFDFIRRLTGILAAVKSDQLPRMRVTAAYWVALFSEYVPPAPSSAEAAVRAAPFVEAVTVGQSVIESLIDSTQTIQIRGGINLIYKNEIFYYSPQKNTDLVTVSSTIYGDSTQQNRLGDENGLLNWKKPGAAGRTDDKRPAQNTLVEKETRLRLSNLYHVEARDTLRTIAQKQLGNETYARQIALINIGVNGLVLSGIIKDVDGLKDIGKPLEELVKLDTEIEFDTVLIMPMKVQFAYDLFARRGGADNAYEFLSTRFYLYVSEETKKKLKDWDERKILQAQVKRLQNGDLETFYDYIAPP